MNSIVSVKVTIAGRDYKLRTDDTPEYLLETAADLDGRISQLLRDNPSFGIQNAAVIAALTALDDARKANEAIDNIRGQIKAYVADAAKTRAAKDKLTERIQALEATVEFLDKVNKQLEKENKELKKNQSPFEGEQLQLGGKDASDTEPAPSKAAPVKTKDAAKVEDKASDKKDAEKAAEPAHAPEAKTEEAEEHDVKDVAETAEAPSDTKADTEQSTETGDEPSPASDEEPAEELSADEDIGIDVKDDGVPRRKRKRKR